LKEEGLQAAEDLVTEESFLIGGLDVGEGTGTVLELRSELFFCQGFHVVIPHFYLIAGEIKSRTSRAGLARLPCCYLFGQKITGEP
jgi:hypothetical protein